MRPHLPVIYSERADDYTNNLDRLSKKFDTARTLVPKPEVEEEEAEAKRAPKAKKGGGSAPPKPKPLVKV